MANVLITALALLLHSTTIGVYLRWDRPQWLLYVDQFFQYTAVLSAGLAVFNLFPIPPLDGSKVLFSFLPRPMYGKLLQYERFGFLVLLFLLWFGVLDGPLVFLREGLLDLLWPVCRWPFDLLIRVSA